MKITPGGINPTISELDFTVGASATAIPKLVGVNDGQVNGGINGLNLKEGPGARGVSKGGVGVAGSGVDGVVGEGTHNGIVGRSKAAGHSGIWADNSGGGKGVAGTSDGEGGVGVYGRGKRLAGQFEGDVEINGKLSLQGVDVINRLAMALKLEDKLANVGNVTQLQNQVNSALSQLQTANLKIAALEQAIAQLTFRIAVLESR